MFHEIIKDLQKTGEILSIPRSFQEYVFQKEGASKFTAQHISINSFKDLAPALRENGYMVFRLGSPNGRKNTEFALAKVVNSWSDYFLIDEDIFLNYQLEIFLPIVSVRSLFVFQLLPKLTETSLVNLAIASGLLSEALGISSKESQLVPATGQSSFTFDFKPTSYCDESLIHNKGQVEIDALFVGKRNGKECLFVIEAKSGEKYSSLAKHKLLYPILSLQNNIPSYMEVIPVYLRTIRRNGYIEFNIAECELPRINGCFGALDELTIKKVSRFSLLGY